jgi:hypothetical protein
MKNRITAFFLNTAAAFIAAGLIAFCKDYIGFTSLIYILSGINIFLSFYIIILLMVAFTMRICLKTDLMFILISADSMLYIYGEIQWILKGYFSDPQQSGENFYWLIVEFIHISVCTIYISEKIRKNDRRQT